MADSVTEISLAELRQRGVVRVSGPQGEALVVLVDGEVMAYSGVCPHLGGPLLEGAIRDDRVICPWHQYEWDLRSGKCHTIPGRNWEGVEGYTRPTVPYSGRLTRVACELTGDSVRLTLRTPS